MAASDGGGSGLQPPLLNSIQRGRLAYTYKGIPTPKSLVRLGAVSDAAMGDATQTVIASGAKQSPRQVGPHSEFPVSTAELPKIAGSSADRKCPNRTLAAGGAAAPAPSRALTPGRLIFGSLSRRATQHLISAVCQARREIFYPKGDRFE